MKRNIIIACAALALCVACSKKEKAPAEDYGTPQEQKSDVPKTDDVALGESLVNASDCKTCHHKTNKIIGPAHLDVAKKYDFTEENVNNLAQKIIKGGSGVWGQVPMTAHADLSEADAKKMARYVLSLDGEKAH